MLSLDNLNLSSKDNGEDWDEFNISLQEINPVLLQFKNNVIKNDTALNNSDRYGERYGCTASDINLDEPFKHNSADFKKVTKKVAKKKIDLSVKLNIVNIKRNYKKCPKCDIYGKISDNIILCESCGLKRPWDHDNGKYSISIEQNYNTSSNTFMAFNIIGKNSYCYQRSFLKTCAKYPSYRNNNNRKEIINKIYQYNGNKIPINVCNITADLFDQIKRKNYVFRGNGKWGVIGACLFYACIMNNLTRTPREIASIIGIEDRFLSQGDKILQELNELGIINVPTTFKPLGDYIDQFFPSLKIPSTYKPFIIDLIATAEKRYIHIGNESRMTTKCIGCIYLLCKRIPKLKHIKKDKISRECLKISKSTFIRYYNLLMSNPKKIKKVFKRHCIPQPISWRNI